MTGGFSGVLYALFGYIWMKSRYEPALGLWVWPRTRPAVDRLAVLLHDRPARLDWQHAHVAGLVVGVVIGVTPHLWRS